MVILFEMFSKVISLFLLGLKFTQTPTSKNELKGEVEKICQNVRLAIFFNESNDGQQDTLDHT